MNRPEEAIQRAIVAYLRVALPDDVTFWATPNQRGTRKGWEMGLLSALGVRPGIPDLFVLHAGRLIGLEVKAPKGRVSDAQATTAAVLRQAGGRVIVVRSVEDVEQVLAGLGVPLKGRVAA